MTKITIFTATHRVIVNASAKRGYNILTIDADTGLFKRDNVNQNDTAIRVNENILGEEFGYFGNKPLTLKETLKVCNKFNMTRKELGFKSLLFDRIENVYAKSL